MNRRNIRPDVTAPITLNHAEQMLVLETSIERFLNNGQSVVERLLEHIAAGTAKDISDALDEDADTFLQDVEEFKNQWRNIQLKLQNVCWAAVNQKEKPL